MDNNTISIDVAAAESLFLDVEKMRKNLELLRKKIIKLFPVKYGSELWWEKSTNQALKEIKQDKGMEFEKVEEAVKWLNS